MSITRGVCSAVVGILLIASAVAAAEPEPQWTVLFDGTNLDAWDPDSRSPPSEWEVKDGVLSTRENGDGWLKSRKLFRDFELRLEFRMSPKANSGVFLRADGFTPHIEGLEVQLLDDQAFPEVPVKTACGALMLESGPRERASKKADEWQTLYIKCHGPKVTVKLNGTLVIEEDLSLNPDRAKAHPGRSSVRGHVGLQNRGERGDFRKIEVRELQ